MAGNKKGSLDIGLEGITITMNSLILQLTKMIINLENYPHVGNSCT